MSFQKFRNYMNKTFTKPLFLHTLYWVVVDLIENQHYTLPRKHLIAFCGITHLSNFNAFVFTKTFNSLYL